MEWILPSSDDKAIIEEINRESDRGLIIVGVSYLETRLEGIIKLLMMPNISPTDYKKMFSGYGPLSSFSSKIDLGYLLQIYPLEMKTVLHKLRDLRNDAAHEKSHISFKDNSVRDRSEHIHNAVTTNAKQFNRHTFRLAYAVQTRDIRPEVNTMLSVKIFRMTTMNIDNDDSDQMVRRRFLNTIQNILVEFMKAESIFSVLQLALPTDDDILPSRDKPS